MSTEVSVGCEKHDVRDGEVIRMRDGQERRTGANLHESHVSAIVKPQLRRATVADDLDATPQHVLRVARAEGLHGRFLGREPGGKMDGRLAAAVAVGDLALGEHAVEKTIAVGFDRLRDAEDIRGIHADADDVRHA